MERRKILFTDGMSSDFLLIITDAPKEDIEKYCRWHNLMMENGGRFELFAPLKAKHYVKELLDSEIDDLEDVDIIGFDACYDFGQYTNIKTYKVKLVMSEEYTIKAQNATEAEELARDKFGNNYLIDDVEVTEIGG